MSDYRDIFNALISAIVETRVSTPSRRGIKLATLARVLTRESLNEFLWDAYRGLGVGESMTWGNIEAEKTQTHLVIRIIAFGRKKRVTREFMLSTNGRGLEESQAVRKIVTRGLSGPLLFAETTHARRLRNETPRAESR